MLTYPTRDYVPDDFEHLAVVPWPWTTCNQQDWIDSLFTLEDWLNARVGPHYTAWTYSNYPNLEYTQACVAFKYSKHKTLFLLTWA